MRTLWSELRSPELAEAVARNAVVLVPIGATEQHGPHLPVGVDSLIGSAIARQVCERVREKMVAIYLPVVWTGYSPQHVGFAGTITLEAETFLRLISDLCRSIWSLGFRRILLLNTHGKNRHLLSTAAGELNYRYGISVVQVTYWNLVAEYLREWRASKLGGINHAGEMETSLMLHLYADLVHMEDAKEEIPTPTSPYLTYDLALLGGITVERKVAELSGSGIVGDPTVATGARGGELFEHIVSEISRFLLEFDAWS